MSSWVVAARVTIEQTISPIPAKATSGSMPQEAGTLGEAGAALVEASAACWRSMDGAGMVGGLI